VASQSDHAHEHGHGHAHAGHAHGARGRALLIALGITLAYALVEAAGGIWFDSLALLSDAGHMLSDALALGLAAFAAWLGARPAGQRHSYGFQRAEVVAAFVNGLALLLVVVFIAVEAVQRLLEPRPVGGLGVMLIASIGLVLNLAVAFIIGRESHDLNTRAALLHVIGDLIGSVAAITAGAVIYFTGWQPVDPLLSLVIGVLILGSTIRLLRDALHVLMEGVPAGLQMDRVVAALMELEGVRAVHDLHVWTISSGHAALSAHVQLDDLSRWPVVLESARRMLQGRFDVRHVTLQPELTGGINAGLRARVRIVPEEELHRHG
jgi:cobalt-zinc-cadmium efflux system protein